MLAMLSGAPVVPVFVSGSGAALPRGRALPRPAKVRVIFGRPLVFKGEGKRAGDDGRKEAYREAAREMMDAIAGLRERQRAVLKQS
jgi:1-acyl-sn-glycerol-3-phosphate acyltransferase